MEPLIYTIILCTAVVLIICIVRFIANRFFTKNDSNSCIVTLIPITGNNENVEYTVRKLLWNKNWGRYSGQQILLVIVNSDSETSKICEKLCDEYEPVSLCNLCELENYIRNPALMCC